MPLIKIIRVHSHSKLVSTFEGQATTEYILLVSMILLIYLMVTRWISSTGLQKSLVDSLTKEYVATYRYGLSKAKGFDDGGPTLHPRATGSGNFRIFLNTEGQSDGG